MNSSLDIKETKKQLLRDELHRNLNRKDNIGRMSARERLSSLFDDGKYTEVQCFTNGTTGNGDVIPGDGVVTSYGYVNGKKVYAYSQDATLKGGSLGAVQAKKITTLQKWALQEKTPIVALLESGGARIQEGIGALNGYGEIFKLNSISSGKILQIAVIFGSCAGGAVYSPALMDFIFMVKDKSFMFITGKDVVAKVMGERVTSEELGGASMHSTKSGVAHFVSDSELDALKDVANVLSYFQYSKKELKRSALKNSKELGNIIPENPKKSYDIKDVINNLSDKDSFVEVNKDYAKNSVVGLARIKGLSVGVVANQPCVLAGCLDINSSLKISNFIKICNDQGLPIVTLVDTPGYLPGKNQEQSGIINYGAKVLYAYSTATVPLISVVVRKAYGGAYIAMCSKSLGANRSYAWPNSEIAVLGAESAIVIIYRKELKTASDMNAFVAQKTQEYKKDIMNAFCAAEKGFIDDIIDPDETRDRIFNDLSFLEEEKKTILKEKTNILGL
jgi:acetyl-CoA carboxylase carboxyltransferase component